VITDSVEESVVCCWEVCSSSSSSSRSSTYIVVLLLLLRRRRRGQPPPRNLEKPKTPHKQTEISNPKYDELIDGCGFFFFPRVSDICICDGSSP
jgi:hypothetical protein